ncbi:MAG TPA: tetratricopeptide repeat protein [Chthoniobacterales bacterium]|jgi:predicted negative regulator of RcsB-dependent stress response
MATPKSLPVAPASDEPEYEIDSFELLWEKHKTRIIAGAVALVVVIVAVFAWFIIGNARASAAEAAFAAAQTPADYRAVVEKYGYSPVAGDASLLLAASLRTEKKYDEANSILDAFIKAQPKHPFVPLARIAVAENLALSGKVADAATALETLAQTDSASFAAPYALWTAAELKAAQGQREAAVRAYRELQKTFPTSVSAQVAAPMAEALAAVVEQPAVSPTPKP